MDQHIYTSLLGNSFVSWQEWITKHVFDEEWVELDCNRIELLESSEIFSKYFRSWILDQQITSHIIVRDGVEIFKEEFDLFTILLGETEGINLDNL